ncbi:MAG TPA: aminotransferase class IV [Anaerolineales bacterium]|nr:aminotransferase class IV [Anaerolineales bacterium]
MKVTGTKADEIRFDDESSLDAITRQLPEGWYSTFRTYDSCTHVIGLTTHLKRLPHVDASSLRLNLTQLLKPYRPGEARVRVMETRSREFYISIEPLKPLPRQIFERGVRVETTTIQRRDPRVKSTAFIIASDAQRKHLAQEGIFEALLVKNERILEGMTSNFFYILRAERSEESFLRRARSKRASTAGLTSIRPSAQRGMLCTAGRGILPGVTRTMVIRAARGRGVQVRYRALKLDQIPAVSEAFITSSSRGIVPVIQIDDVPVGQGRVGDVTKILMQAYYEYVLTHAEKIA